MSADTEQFIDEYDEEHGTAWSDSKEGVAKFAETFANKQLQEVKETIEKGTRNRRSYKGWEMTVFSLCDKFGAE